MQTGGITIGGKTIKERSTIKITMLLLSNEDR